MAHICSEHTYLHHKELLAVDPMFPPKKVTEQDYAYLAGLLDGDGHIGINRKDVREASIKVVIGSNYRWFVYSLKEKFGGNCHPRNKEKDYWFWQVCGKNAISILQKCLPYLVLKKKEAIVAIKWETEKLPLIYNSRGNGRKCSNEEVLRREELKRLLHEIKKYRGEINA